MFDSVRRMQGYHGAWSETDFHIPLILSGTGIRVGAQLGTCELIDARPHSLSCLAVRYLKTIRGACYGKLWTQKKLCRVLRRTIGYWFSADNILRKLKQLKRGARAGRWLGLITKLPARIFCERHTRNCKRWSRSEKFWPVRFRMNGC